MERKRIVELAEEIAEKSNCDMSQMDGRDYEIMWCGRAEFEKMAVDIFKEGQKYEREACAKACDKERVQIVIDGPEERAYNNACYDCAAAIRARGKK